jgi:hypothetical protein
MRRTPGSTRRFGRRVGAASRRAGAELLVALALAAAPAAAQRAGDPPPAGASAAGSPADSLGALPDSARRMHPITGDADPAGAIIELRQRLRLDDGQLATLRQLRHAQQRLLRAVRDSLDALNVPVGVVPVAGVTLPGRDGRPPRGAPAGRTLTEAQRDAVRALTDTVRTVTRVTRDEALAVLTPAQRDTLDAMERLLADSLAARRGRPR